LFQETIREACLNKYLFEMANIRDQCSWVHMHNPAKATEKAKDLVRMAIARVKIARPLKLMSLPVIQSALVIGGGIAGMTAALTLAGQGFEVSLLEKTSALGGMAHRLYYNLDQENIMAYVTELISKVKKHPLITLYMNTTIIDVTGYVGNFVTEIMRYKGKAIEKIEHGVAIIATGAREYTPQDYLYGKDKRVMTQLELEEKIVKHDHDILACSTLVMILCAGSRNDDHRYCSKVCCMQAIKNALKLKETNPGMEIFILYRDMRTYGLFEKHYKQARAKGIIFLCYEKDSTPIVQQISSDGQEILQVEFYDNILGEKIAIHTDILALSVPMVPPEDAGEIATLYKVPRNEDGFFLEAHVKLRPVDFATDGVFVCGLAHSPKSIPDSIIQAKAAASRASAILSKEYFQAQGIVCEIPADICSGCGVCVSQCPYKAITIDREKNIAIVNEALCKGCGGCAAACPSGAAQQRGFTGRQVIGMIDAALL
jgi:heterodisulfide reductase subunit A